MKKSEIHKLLDLQIRIDYLTAKHLGLVPFSSSQHE